MLPRHAFRGCVAAVLASVLSGCAQHYLGEVAPGYAIVTPQAAILATPNVKIHFVEDGKTMVPNEPFTPSRLWDAYWWAPKFVATDGYKPLIEPHGCLGVDHTTNVWWRDGGQYEHYVYIQSASAGSPIEKAGLVGAEVKSLNGQSIENSDAFWNIIGYKGVSVGQQIAFEAKHGDGSSFSGTLVAAPCSKPLSVKIEVDGQAKPLDGVLVFNRVMSTAPANAQRVWHIEIPDHYIIEATGGRVSVVFQPFPITYQTRDIMTNQVTTVSDESVSWVLWMSDLPLQ